MLRNSVCGEGGKWGARTKVVFAKTGIDSCPPPLPPFGRPHRLGLPMVVCVECLPADKPWDMVSATRRSSGVAPRACVRVYARVLVPPNLYIHKYMPRNTTISCKGQRPGESQI